MSKKIVTVKLAIEKLEESLSLEEQQEMLESLCTMELATFGYIAYCKSIGREEEARKFVQQFMENASQESLAAIMDGDKKTKGVH